MKVNDEEMMESLVGRGIRIPPQPEILNELQCLLNREDVDARSIAQVISKDLGISAALFKVARSVLYQRSTAVDSLEQILILLGFEQTYNLARAVALSTSLSADNRKVLGYFWSRSRDVALLASIIAEERVSVCNIFPDQAYLAGIFMECGVPVLMQRFPSYGLRLLKGNRFTLPTLREEDQLFNVDHCSIGYLVARHWKLPDFLALAILHHYEIPPGELGSVRTMVAILHLALHAYEIVSGHPEPGWASCEREVMLELGLDHEGLAEYLADVREKFLDRAV